MYVEDADEVAFFTRFPVPLTGCPAPLLADR